MRVWVRRLGSKIDLTSWYGLLAYIFFLRIHCFEGFFLFWAIVGGKVGVISMKMVELDVGAGLEVKVLGLCLGWTSLSFVRIVGCLWSYFCVV